MGHWLNVGCGTHRAPDPWINLDVHADDDHRPDLVIDPADPFAAFDARSAERVYLGHVLEHVRWPLVGDLLACVRAVLAPGGLVLATGPDVYRTVTRWRDGAEPWDLVVSVLEHADEADPGWPEAVHHWNCHETRLVGALTAAGFLDVAPSVAFDGWPVVAWSEWQCAAGGVNP